jgi:hypothetical protein
MSTNTNSYTNNSMFKPRFKDKFRRTRRIPKFWDKLTNKIIFEKMPPNAIFYLNPERQKKKELKKQINMQKWAAKSSMRRQKYHIIKKGD